MTKGISVDFFWSLVTRRFLILIALGIHMMAIADINPPITSVKITTRTLSALPSCLHYKIKGVCFWQAAGITSTTPYISHYLPDIVVSVFNKFNENPWLEIRNTLDQAGALTEQQIIKSIAKTQAGGGQHEFNDPQQQNTFFKAVDIVGNPALLTLPTEPLLLLSTATPLKPYFQSMLDSILWRGFSPFADFEQTYATATLLTRYIGKDGGLVNWGNAIPFEGKIQTSNDAKAAAVVAQRASNLITTQHASGFGHIYQPLSTKCGQGCTAATIKERDDDTQFQMIYPIDENRCQVFGSTINFGNKAEVQTNGAYIWVVWRKYEGCVQGVGEYMGRT